MRLYGAASKAHTTPVNSCILTQISSEAWPRLHSDVSVKQRLFDNESTTNTFPCAETIMPNYALGRKEKTFRQIQCHS